MPRHADLIELERLGVIVPEAQDFIQPGWKHDFHFAMDAQPALATVGNSAVPAFLNSYLDPTVIDVLFSPMKGIEILGEEKKGDWTSLDVYFLMLEPTGETSSYGDYSNGGTNGINVNFPQRQPYHFQTISQWGQKELAMAEKQTIDWVSKINLASVLTLAKFYNQSIFFGIANLRNYGLLNDPSLPAPISPTGAWSSAGPDVIYEDIRRLFAKLQTQSGGNVDNATEMTLAMSPTVLAYLDKTNLYNVNVGDQIKKNYPNLKIVTAVEYNVAGSGQLIQLIANNLMGQKTGTAAYTEKMRAHGVVRGLSDFAEKKSAGTLGAIIFRPMLIAAMQPIT